MYIGGLNSGGIHRMLDGLMTDLISGVCARAESCVLTLMKDATVDVRIFGGSIEPKDMDFVRLDDSTPLDTSNLLIAAALSDRLTIDLATAGKRYRRDFIDGIREQAETSSSNEAPSLRIRFRPDSRLFGPHTEVDRLPLFGRAVEWAVFNPHLKISVSHHSGDRRDYRYPQGLISLACEQQAMFGGPYARHCQLTEPMGSAEAVIIDRYDDGFPIILTYVNGRAGPGIGPHLEGLESGARELLRARKRKLPFHSARNPFAALTILLSVHLDDVQWAGATRSTLADPRAYEIVRRMITEQLPTEEPRRLA